MCWCVKEVVEGEQMQMVQVREEKDTSAVRLYILQKARGVPIQAIKYGPMRKKHVSYTL
jgi:hypothetical protein